LRPYISNKTVPSKPHRMIISSYFAFVQENHPALFH
jgi:hypothetical protein